MRPCDYLTLCVGLLLTGCPSTSGGTGAGSSGTQGSGNDCTPGMSVACGCTDGAMGAQICNADGDGFGECECDGSSITVTAESGNSTNDPTAGSSGASATDASATATATVSGGSSSSDSASGSSGGSTDGGNVIDLDGWTRRVPITITNELSDDLDDFQVLIPVQGDPDMEPDFDDLRFTAEDGITEVLYWLEYTTVPVEAAAWVRVPHIPANESVQLWMYYGNPDADSASDGDATMFFADDFEGAMLDAGKWAATDAYDVSNGVLTVESGAVYTNDAVIGEDQILQVRAATTCCEQAGYIANVMSALAQDMSINFAFLRLEGDSLVVQYSDGMISGPNNAVNLGNLGSDYFRDVAIGRTAGQAHFRMWLPPNSLSYGSVQEGDHYAVLGHYMGASSGTNNIRDYRYDAAFVRRFAAIEPTVEIGAEEDWP